MKFNNFYNPIKVKPENQSNKYISGNELGYNEHGQVVVIEKAPINLYEITQSYVEEQSLAAQLRKIEQGIQKPLPEISMDISSINPDTINEDRIETQKQVLKQKKQLENSGIDTDKLLKANNKEIEAIVAEYVKKKIEEQKGVKEDVK